MHNETRHKLCMMADQLPSGETGKPAEGQQHSWIAVTGVPVSVSLTLTEDLAEPLGSEVGRKRGNPLTEEGLP